MQDVTAKDFTPEEGIYNLSALLSGQQLFGNLKIGSKNVEIDGKNRRIIVYDTDGVARVLIGWTTVTASEA